MGPLLAEMSKKKNQWTAKKSTGYEFGVQVPSNSTSTAPQTNCIHYSFSFASSDSRGGVSEVGKEIGSWDKLETSINPLAFFVDTSWLKIEHNDQGRSLRVQWWNPLTFVSCWIQICSHNLLIILSLMRFLSLKLATVNPVSWTCPTRRYSRWSWLVLQIACLSYLHMIAATIIATYMPFNQCKIESIHYSIVLKQNQQAYQVFTSTKIPTPFDKEDHGTFILGMMSMTWKLNLPLPSFGTPTTR